MDQLKEFMGLFRRQHFWFILPVLLCISAYGWWTAASKVSGEVQKNVSEIGSMHSKADAITTVSAADAPGLGHPNAEWHTVMEQLIASRQKNVLDAWQKKWDRQGEILKWPADAFGPRSADVIPIVEQLRPIEKQDFTVNANKLPSVARSDYKDFMKNQLPVIAAKIGAIWDPQGTFIDAVTGAKRAVTDPTEEVPIGYDKPMIVKWNPASQKAIEDSYSWPGTYPSTLEVLYAQEDLWVLGAIVDIIKATNGTARTQATAPVKEIVSIRYGKGVRRNGFIDPPAPVKTGDADGDEPLPGGAATTSTEDPAPENSTEGGVVTPPHPAVGRYVDQNLNPFATIEELKSKLDIAKRIPVQIRVRVDQRYISHLLAACANSPLTYEVRQFRFDPPEEAIVGGVDAFGIAAPPPPPPATAFGYGATASSTTAITLEDVDRIDREVELWGIIYIFNPVDESLLRSGDEDAADVEDVAAVN